MCSRGNRRFLIAGPLLLRPCQSALQPIGGQPMKLASRSLASASLIEICACTSVAARAYDGDDRPNRYVVTNLTSDIQGVAPNTDPVLQNAWGVAFTPA